MEVTYFFRTRINLCCEHVTSETAKVRARACPSDAAQAVAGASGSAPRIGKTLASGQAARLATSTTRWSNDQKFSVLMLPELLGQFWGRAATMQSVLCRAVQDAFVVRN